MQRWTIDHAKLLRIRLRKETKNLCKHLPQPATLPKQPRSHPRIRTTQMRDIQRDQRRARAQRTPKHMRRALRIGNDVELRPGRPVPDPTRLGQRAERGGRVTAQRAAHDAETCEVRAQRGILREQQRDVGQRARGHQPCRAGTRREEDVRDARDVESGCGDCGDRGE